MPIPDPGNERDASLRPRRVRTGVKSYEDRGDLLTTRTAFPLHHRTPDRRSGSGHERAIVAGARDAHEPARPVPVAPHGGTFR